MPIAGAAPLYARPRLGPVIDMRGVTWRRIQFEVSPDEAGIGGEHETIEPPSLTEVREAGIAVFEARAAGATELGRPARAWPPVLTAHGHWVDDYARAAASGGVELSLDAAVAEVNAWIAAVTDSR